MTLFLTVGVRDTNHRDEFHITTFFRVRFAKGVSLLSTSEFLLLGVVRLHQPDQVKHYLFGGVRSFITITGDSGFLFTLLRTRF